MAERVPIGSTFGRWKVERYAPPAHRAGDAYMRPRVLVRCACGHEQLVFEVDLKRGRTGGCRSSRCREHAKQRELAQALGLLEALHGQLAEAQRRIAAALTRNRHARQDDEGGDVDELGGPAHADEDL